MTPRILIRTEVGGEYGLGHATRCLALAHALATNGAAVQFETTTPALQAFVAPLPCVVDTDRAWYDTTTAMDCLIYDTKSVIAEAWYGSMMDAGKQVIRIDHPQATPDSCNLLIGPGAHWAPLVVEQRRAALGPRFLYGWDYVMLDAEVTGHTPLPYAPRQGGSIVFCAGGSDPSMALEKIAQWSGELPKDMHLCFAIPHHAEQAYSRPPWGEWVPFSRGLLREAALVVSMFGVTCYEALWYQTPLLMLSHTDENDWGTFYLGRASHDAARRLGPLAAHTAATFTTALSATWTHPKARPSMHAAATGLMDGQGLARIATAILELVG